MVVSFEVAIVQIRRGITFPSSYMACCGANDLSEVSFTGLSFFPLTLIW